MLGSALAPAWEALARGPLLVVQRDEESLLVLLVPELLELDRGQVAKRTVKTFVTVFLIPVAVPREGPGPRAATRTGARSSTHRAGAS